jgi:hypothetical protein
MWDSFAESKKEREHSLGTFGVNNEELESTHFSGLQNIFIQTKKNKKNFCYYRNYCQLEKC